MIVDSSALLSVLQQEQEADAVSRALLQWQPRRLSAASFVEVCIVVEERLAREAFRHFGKGRHKAGLNFGDCFSYALAKSLDEPLLCTGNDFRMTDIAVVL